MSDFFVNTSQLAREQNRMVHIGEVCKEVNKSVSSVENGLTGIGLGEVARAVVSIQGKLSRHSRTMDSLSNSLTSINLKYTQTENLIAGKLLNNKDFLVFAQGTSANPSKDALPQGTSANPSEKVFGGENYYGANQEGPAATEGSERNRLKAVVQEYFPYMSNAQVNGQKSQVDIFFEKISREGCAYASMTNAIFNEYIGREEEFESTFGFSMYDPEGNLNFNEMLIRIYCEVDNHVQKSKWVWDLSWEPPFVGHTEYYDYYDATEDDVQIQLENGMGYIYEGYGVGNTATDFAYRMQLYCQNHGVNVSVELLENSEMPVPGDFFGSPNDGVPSIAEKGTTSILVTEPFYIVDENEVKHTIPTGHYMTVTGVSEDGQSYIVSSWGNEYTLPVSEMQGMFASMQIVSFN